MSNLKKLPAPPVLRLDRYYWSHPVYQYKIKHYPPPFFDEWRAEYRPGVTYVFPKGLPFRDRTPENALWCFLSYDSYDVNPECLFRPPLQWTWKISLPKLNV